MKLQHIFCFVLVFSGLALAAVPSWVQPGVVVSYDGYSAFVQGGQYQSPVQTVVTMETVSVAGNSVSGTTFVSGPGAPGVMQSYPWTCVEGGACEWRYWVDPSNPTGSVKGPNGEVFSVVGSAPYSYGGYAVQDATMMAYENAQTGVEYHITFETRTGLVLAYAEKYPSQQTFLYINSVNIDLSGYQPSDPQAPVNPLPQEPGNNTYVPGPAPEGQLCGSLAFALALGGLSLGIARRRKVFASNASQKFRDEVAKSI